MPVSNLWCLFRRLKNVLNNKLKSQLCKNSFVLAKKLFIAN